MRRILPIVLIAAASSLPVNGTVVHAAGGPEALILSSANGALLPPDDWTCDEYVAEYRAFLEAGNKPSQWRFAGKRYRDESDGGVYDWQMWLDWYDRQNCGGPAKAAETQSSAGNSGGGGGFGGMTAVGIVAGLLGVGAIAAGGGGGGDSDPPSKSPG